MSKEGVETSLFSGVTSFWAKLKNKYPNSAQFLVFFLLSNGVTVLQLLLMPFFRSIFANTTLVSTSFQIWQVGTNTDGSPYYIFDYAAGAIAAGGGGGLAYFLAVQIAIAIAQIINFFAQRSITFKSNSSIWRAAFWYFVAYVIITIVAAAALGLYQGPVYNFFMNTLGWGSLGETSADIFTMIINSAISFWVFFPIFKIIFKQVPGNETSGKGE
ncbi:hypothetical protein AWH56_021515 [Anaerobacillus isosaccharinicus]|uniref:GtrA-like protein domain-containing protein n=1 Tax=Anaerobacillus isosaccharinicus TaxID=1532552 RepID=A0A1S2MF97_9BACI|nr:hypothetical protein [Anaerobacillus isosaccharinicus]MBA5586516.1 hypothetical protein [Anaerobacillus isosaccharinicus]QOY35243.1 hypothetical protein AWH56_021515 [Anaerobacillus isosaccharinicus]